MILCKPTQLLGLGLLFSTGLEQRGLGYTSECASEIWSKLPFSDISLRCSVALKRALYHPRGAVRGGTESRPGELESLCPGAVGQNPSFCDRGVPAGWSDRVSALIRDRVTQALAKTVPPGMEQLQRHPLALSHVPSLGSLVPLAALLGISLPHPSL